MQGTSSGPAGTKMRSFWHDPFFSISGRRLDLHYAFWFFAFSVVCRSFQWEMLCQEQVAGLQARKCAVLA